MVPLSIINLPAVFGFSHSVSFSGFVPVLTQVINVFPGLTIQVTTCMCDIFLCFRHFIAFTSQLMEMEYHLIKTE